MHVYKFRILLEDIEDFCRDIEISAGDTFESFHKAIIQAADLSGKELASFYICDSKWNRRKEVSLMDMSDGEEQENPPLLMHKCKLSQFIDDPHQRMIYVYDYLNMYEFYIELSKIVPAEKGEKYPRCVKKLGMIPKTGAQILNVPAEFDEEEVIYEDAATGDDENDGSELYSDADLPGGFVEESGEASESFDEDKF
jgi:hypothetical protein